MGCVSSKILTKSGSFQEKVSHSFQSSNNNVIEEIILSSSKSNGDQFLALLCTSTSSTRKAAVDEPEQSSAVTAAAEPPVAKIETINVSELLAGLEEEGFAAVQAEQEQQSDDDRKEGGKSPAQCAPSDGGAAGRARSFRTVEEFDALVTQSGSSQRAAAPAPEPEQEEPGTAPPAAASSQGATDAAAESSSSSGQEQEPAAAGKGEDGAKRRARARQLGELKVPTTFDFSKSGSLRDWLLRGGQIFSPGSYVTPRFGTAPAAPAAERGGGGGENAGEKQPQQEQHAVFDPELVAQFERAMEQLSEDEERVLTEILEALELVGTGKEDSAALGKVSDQPAAVAVAVRQED